MDELSPLMQAPARVYPQGDPELIQLVREKYLLPPAKGPYQNIRATEDTSMGQGQLIRKLFGNKVAMCYITMVLILPEFDVTRG